MFKHKKNDRSIYGTHPPFMVHVPHLWYTYPIYGTLTPFTAHIPHLRHTSSIYCTHPPFTVHTPHLQYTSPIYGTHPPFNKCQFLPFIKSQFTANDQTVCPPPESMHMWTCMITNCHTISRVDGGCKRFDSHEKCISDVSYVHVALIIIVFKCPQT